MKRLELARFIWRAAGPIEGTVAQTYLRARGIETVCGGSLRFNPACPFGADRVPALVALMTDPASGEPVGVHRTALRSDGSGKAGLAGGDKRMLGGAGVIRLADGAPGRDGKLGLAEGIENGLSVIQAGWQPIWSCGSAGAIKRFPVLPFVTSLTVFADADAVGIEAASTACRRYRAAGRRAVALPPLSGDWNDALRGARS